MAINVSPSLIADREGALYVDLVDADGELIWGARQPSRLRRHRTDLNAAAITTSGLTTPQGLRHLRQSWAGSDPHDETDIGWFC
jgi:hypothetical protein